MSTRGRPGTVPASDVSLVSDVGERIAEVTHGGGAKAAPIADNARMGRKSSAIGQRSTEAERSLKQMRAAFDTERAALEARYRAAEAYAVEVSERLILVRDALREHTERATVYHRDKEAAIARQKAELATTQEAERKLHTELAQEKKRGLDERIRGDELAEKLKSAERATQVAEDQNKALNNQLRAAGNTTATLRSQIATLQKQKAIAEKHAVQIRNTIAFQLGQALIQAGEAWSGARVLPTALMGLLGEARRRKRRRQERERLRLHDGGSPARAISGPCLLQSPTQAMPARRNALYVLDEISELNLKSHFEFTRLRKGPVAEQIATSGAQFVFLESCWKWNGGDWEHAFTSPNLQHANAQALLGAIAEVRKRGVPVVFWNKEDPMHFDRFLPIAEKADVILTTDSNKIAEYRRKVPHAKVDVMRFAASPSICNPTDRTRVTPGSVCFAGAYYPEHHDERVRQMNHVLPAIEAFKGTIYDRYSHHPTERYRFPERYRPFIRPSVPFSEIVKIYKQFKVFLNVNTIVDSPTMMSRRVYEVLASGTPVVSAPSRALQEQFAGIVATGETEAEIKSLVGALLDDEDHWLRTAHRGLREVMSKHTYAAQAGRILGQLGLGGSAATPLVSIIVATCRPKNVDRTIENIVRQCHPRSEVIYVVTPNFKEEDRARLASVKRRSSNIERAEVLVMGHDVPLGACLNEAVRASRGEYISKLDDDNFYLDHFISDLLLPFQQDDYDVVGKESYFCYLGGLNRMIWRFPEKRHRATKFVAGDAMMLRRRVFERNAFPERRVGEDTKLLEDIVARGGRIYTADHFNFLKYRSADLNEHTWREGEETLLRQSVDIGKGLDVERVRV